MAHVPRMVAVPKAKDKTRAIVHRGIPPMATHGRRARAATVRKARAGRKARAATVRKAAHVHKATVALQAGVRRAAAAIVRATAEPRLGMPDH
jgi:hypothetical protein